MLNSKIKKIIALLCLFSSSVFASSAFAHESEKNINVEVITKSSASWDGETLPTYPQGQPEVTILKITIAPKAKLPLHQHFVINAGVLLTGKLTVITEKGETLHMSAGDPIVEVVDKWHYGINEGESPAQIIVFYAGIKGKANTLIKQEE